jgi:hypothetical protein
VNKTKIIRPDIMMDENGNPIKYTEEDTIDHVTTKELPPEQKARERVEKIIKAIRDRKTGA